ncbi:hypothetical protein Sjap_023420 [Stephania japonica]|uniref:CCT domain-containing protein n=1 Tax=Stephania japonica TaxID=461633 RepID=A0AAP0EGS9_9MAGN
MCANKQKTARSMKPKIPTAKTARRKSRTKSRKRRLISLLRDQNPSPENHQNQQLTLFPPLHPEPALEEEEEEASSLFAAADAGGAAATLTDLLFNEVESTEEEEGEEGDTWSATAIRCGPGSWLEKAALRGSGKSEERTELERWVRYSELVEKREKEKEEEVTSCPAEYFTNECSTPRGGGLLLKLDYQEIMDAWIDKGSLYIDGDQGPAIVPDVLDDVVKREDHSESSVKVPEMSNGEVGKDREAGEGWKTGRDREARVLRYKEKRQSRLFAKRIRYEVRKLNAEKRPRIKLIAASISHVTMA